MLAACPVPRRWLARSAAHRSMEASTRPRGRVHRRQGTEGNGLESLPARPPTPDTDDAVCTESHPGARLIHQLALNSQHGRPHPFPAIGRLRQDCLSSEVSLDYG